MRCPMAGEYSESHASRSVQDDGDETQDEGKVLDLEDWTLEDLADVQVSTKCEVFKGRQWLEEVRAAGQRGAIGFDMHWRADRAPGSDNPVALLVFARVRADDVGGVPPGSALLLRTHRTLRWLPQIVSDLLKSPNICKVCPKYDRGTRQKFLSAFGFEPMRVVDLDGLAGNKGLDLCGLKSFSRYLGINLQREAKLNNSDWAVEHLTDRQIRHAAEGAYFARVAYGELEQLSAVSTGLQDDATPEPHSVLSMQPGWAEQGVVRQNSGLWCMLCQKGPILHGDVMAKHLESKLHQKKMQPERSPADLRLQDGWEQQGIELRHDGFWCVVCQKGPILNQETMLAHIHSKLHQKKSGCELDTLLSAPDETTRTEAACSGATTPARAPINVGHRLRACRAVAGPPPGYEPENFMTLQAGDVVLVEGIDASDAAWLWVKADNGQRQRGWVEAAHFDHVEHGGGDDDGALEPEQPEMGASTLGAADPRAAAAVMSDDTRAAAAAMIGDLTLEAPMVRCVRCVSRPPPGWSADNFLLAEVGQKFEVKLTEDSWIWAVAESGAQGWIPREATAIYF